MITNIEEPAVGIPTLDMLGFNESQKVESAGDKCQKEFDLKGRSWCGIGGAL